MSDIVGAIEFFLEFSRGQLGDGIVNIGSSRIRTLLEVAELVQTEHARISGRMVSIRTGSDDDPERPVRLLDTTKASSVGFTPQTDLRKEIRRTLVEAAHIPASVS